MAVLNRAIDLADPSLLEKLRRRGFEIDQTEAIERYLDVRNANAATFLQNDLLLGDRQIISCHLPGSNPDSLRGCEFSFLRPGSEPKRIRFTGWSTASDIKGRVFDFQYTGERIDASEVDASCVITDAPASEPEAAGKSQGP